MRLLLLAFGCVNLLTPCVCGESKFAVTSAEFVGAGLFGRELRVKGSSDSGDELRVSRILPPLNQGGLPIPEDFGRLFSEGDRPSERWNSASIIVGTCTPTNCKGRYHFGGENYLNDDSFGLQVRATTVSVLAESYDTVPAIPDGNLEAFIIKFPVEFSFREELHYHSSSPPETLILEGTLSGEATFNYSRWQHPGIVTDQVWYAIDRVSYDFTKDDPVTAFAGPGDSNFDGVVDFADFLTLSANFGGQGSWLEGDFTNDGLVSFEDFLILSSHFQGNQAAAVPESSTIGLVTLGLTVVLLSIRRSRR